jgi:hypothetical protein
MRLKDARANVDYLSPKAGDVGRQLALGGIAVVWLLHGDPKSLVFPLPLLEALVGFLLALGIDFIQYWMAATIWAIFARLKELFFEEQGIDPNDENDQRANFKVKRSMNWFAIACFHGKAVALLYGGWKLGWYLWDKIAAAPI